VVKESPASGWKLWRWSGACHGTETSCSLRVRARRFGFVTASFVPPGDRLNPYPLGTAATLQGGWSLKVNSATINADTLVEAVIDPDTGEPANPPPPAGAQYTLVNVSMTYVGGGSSYLDEYLYDSVYAEGAGNAFYTLGGCEPPSPDLTSVGPVYSGQTETGNLCYEIASNDAGTLLLTAEGMAGDAEIPVWFSLR
jgi:hypothetical protein